LADLVCYTIGKSKLNGTDTKARTGKHEVASSR
jgi:hypothetical protein